MTRLQELLSWVTANVPKVVAFFGALAALGFSVLYILCVLDILPQCRPDTTPEVTSISPTEVAPGQEFDVTGEHLDRVKGVQLRKGQVVERLFMLPLSDTGMLLAVPIGVAKAEYIIEVREEGKDEFVATKHMLGVIGPNVSDDHTKTIVFAHLNWDSARLQNSVARYIIEKGYSYPTDAIPDTPGNAEDVWKSLLTGSIQVNMEVWLPNSQEEWVQALEQGSVIPLGKSLDLAWQSAFVVPKYMLEENPREGTAHAPGLRKVEDLRDHTEVFAKPGSGGKAVLWNCPSIWNCAEINRQQVRAYGLDDVIELRDPGSPEALVEKLQLANESRRAWLGFMWGPTLVESRVGLTPLDERTCAAGQHPKDGCGYNLARVRIAVHPSLISNAPDIVELLRNWNFKESTQIVAEECLEETKKDFERAAICYLKREQAVWGQWMPPEVSQKVREALK